MDIILFFLETVLNRQVNLANKIASTVMKVCHVELERIEAYQDRVHDTVSFRKACEELPTQNKA